MAKFTHTVMPHSLAKALIESGMKHFDVGGAVGQGTAPASSGVGENGWGVFGPMFGEQSYNAATAPVQETNYSPTVDTASGNALAGYGQSQAIQQQQQTLAAQLLAQSQGAGPNPAQAQLAQNTGQNAAMQSAMLASQRGSGANVGMAGRSAAMAGGAAQQGAVGQAATLQAQQQLAAEGQLQTQQQAMAQGNTAEQNVNANLAGTAGALQTGQNNTNVANYGMAQGINAGVANTNMQTEGQVQGGMFSGAGSAMSSMMYKGGKVPDHIHKMASIYHPNMAAGMSNFKAGGKVPGKPLVNKNSPKNDVVPAMVSPGEDVLPLSVTQSPNAPQKAKEFVQHLMEQERGGKSAKTGKATASNKSLNSRVSALEKHLMGARQ